MTGWGSEEVAYIMETDESKYISDCDVGDWVYEKRKLKLYVCSTCGLICSELIDHQECRDKFSSDWWHLDVKCINPPKSEHSPTSQTDDSCVNKIKESTPSAYNTEKPKVSI